MAGTSEQGQKGGIPQTEQVRGMLIDGDEICPSGRGVCVLVQIHLRFGVALRCRQVDVGEVKELGFLHREEVMIKHRR